MGDNMAIMQYAACLNFLSLFFQSQPKKVSEYGQEIPQLHTTNQPTASITIYDYG